MNDVLARCPLFVGLEERQLSSLAGLGARVALQPGEHLFRLGERADRLYVVLEGAVELCLPLSLRGVVEEIVVETEGPGGALGWSAFVRPHRFQLSARASGPAAVAGFDRLAVLGLIGSDREFGCIFFERVAEMIGRRMLTMEALWARELQRSFAGGPHVSHLG